MNKDTCALHLLHVRSQKELYEYIELKYDHWKYFTWCYRKLSYFIAQKHKEQYSFRLKR